MGALPTSHDTPCGKRRLRRRATSIALFIIAMAAIVRAQMIAAPPRMARAPDRLLVRFAANVPPAGVTAAAARMNARVLKRLGLVPGLYVLRLPSGTTPEAARRAIVRTAGVLYAEPDYLLQATTTPNDPSYPDLWGLHNTGQAGGTPGADIHASDAWAITTGSSNVVVAVIDSGIDYAHADLASNMFRNEADCNSNGVDDDGDGYVDDCYGIDTANHDSNPMDDSGHGTHVAGIVGAVGNNGVGVVGVNWRVKMLACKFMDSTNQGGISDAIECLNYVKTLRDRGVPVIATNNSWGGPAFSQALQDAIDVQRQRGILFITSAGNGAIDNDVTGTFPASYDLPNIIAVASTTRTDGRSPFSNYGRHTIHIGAPGSEILSTSPGNAYKTMSGTSMAAPYVAGVAALLKAQDATRDWRTVKNLILASGDVVSSLSNTVTGRRLNAQRAMTCAGSVLQTRLKPAVNTLFVIAGQAVTLRALHINCGVPNGDVVVQVSTNNPSVTLRDDGVSPDQSAGDGVYSGTFVPGSGSYTLTFPGGDVVIVRPAASFDVSLKAPRCSGAVSTCDTGSLVAGRGTMSGGVELNQPNTINASCADGSSGTYHEDESIDAIRLSTLDGSPIAAGKTVRIDVTVWAFGAIDFLDLYYASNALAPAWSFLATIQAPDAGQRILTATYTVPPGGLQAVRANFRAEGSAAVCSTGEFDDHDDVVFSTPSFTDEPLTPSVAVMKTVHITELRQRIDELRLRFGLAPYAYTDPALTARVTPVKAVHISDLRTALTQAYNAAGRTPPTFTDPNLASGFPIKAAHIVELRAAVINLE